jgi:hypothetical protein
MSNDYAQFSEKIWYYTRSEDVIDWEVVRKTEHLWPYKTILFYAQKRHVLEIAYEFWVSLIGMLAVWSLVVWLTPWEWVDNDVGVIAGCVIAGLLPWLYFGIETWRWNKDFLVLTNYGLFNPHLELRSLNYPNERLDWVTSAIPYIPILHKWAKAKVGVLWVRTADGSEKVTPACAYPDRLNGLIPVAEDARSGDIVEDKEPWQE